MLFEKDAIQRDLKQKERYAVGYLLPTSLDVVRSATLPITGLSVLELFGVFLPIPVAGLAIGASLFALSAIITQITKTAVKHAKENEQVRNLMALNHDPRLIKIANNLKKNEKKEPIIDFVGIETYTLSEYLQQSLSDILGDFFTLYNSLEEKDKKNFLLNRHVECLAEQLTSQVGKIYASSILKENKVDSKDNDQHHWPDQVFQILKTYGLDAAKGLIFGAALASFIIKLLLPTILMSFAPYSALIYLPLIAIGITTYLIIGHFKRKSEENAKTLLQETTAEAEDKIIALELLTFTQDYVASQKQESINVVSINDVTPEEKEEKLALT